MPSPSSWPFSSRRPPASISILIRVAPASMAFSTSSFTTEAGRSTTSPAAIWLARSAGSRVIFPTLAPAPGGKTGGGHQHTPKPMLERTRVVHEAGQAILDVAKPHGHLVAHLDDVAT